MRGSQLPAAAGLATLRRKRGTLSSNMLKVAMSQPVKVGPRCPEDTPFKQQRLPAWQPILTPNWVIGTFFIVSAIFMPIGGAIYAASASVSEVRVNYGEDVTCKAQNPVTGVQFRVSKDMKNPLIYYELTNFYQNHRRYVTSRSDGQLRAAEDAALTTDFTTVAKSQALATCTPLICGGTAGLNGCGTTTSDLVANGRNNLIYYPCGLIARSMFNDTFKNLKGVDPPTELINLNMKKISWPSDIEKKFISPNAERLKPDGTLNQPASQGFISKYCGGFGDFCTSQDAAHPDSDDIAKAACVLSGWCQTPIDPSKPDGPFFTVELLRSILYGANGTPVPGTKRCETLPASFALRPEQIYNCWHSPTDEALIVWMRTAALPTFRKLYARIDGVLKAGLYQIDVDCRFNVAVFGGTKSIVISTTSWIGGKNDFLAGSYLAVGAVCFALALAFLAKHVISPRSLSSPENLEFIK